MRDWKKEKKRKAKVMKEATTMQVYIEEKEDQEEAVDGSKHEGHLSHIND